MYLKKYRAKGRNKNNYFYSTSLTDLFARALADSTIAYYFTQNSGLAAQAFEDKAALYFPDGTVNFTNGAVSGAYLSRKCADENSVTPNKVYVTDTALPLTNGVMMTSFLTGTDAVSIIPTSLGINDHHFITAVSMTADDVEDNFSYIADTAEGTYSGAKLMLNTLGRSVLSGDDDGANIVRRGQLQAIANNSKIVRGIDRYAEEYTDSKHGTAAADILSAELQAIRASYILGKDTSGITGLGPAITSAVLKTDEIELTLVHQNGTDITAPTAGNGGMDAEDDGVQMGSETLERVNATTMKLTFPEGTAPLAGSVVEVFVPYGANGTGLDMADPDVARDNSALTLPIQSDIILATNGDPIQDLDNVVLYFDARGSVKTMTGVEVEVIAKIDGSVASAGEVAAGDNAMWDSTAFDGRGALLLNTGTRLGYGSFTAGGTHAIGFVYQEKYDVASASLETMFTFTSAAYASDTNARMSRGNDDAYYWTANEAGGATQICPLFNPGSRHLILIQFVSTSECNVYVDDWTTPYVTFDPKNSTDYENWQHICLGARNTIDDAAVNAKMSAYFHTTDVLTSGERSSIQSYWEARYNTDGTDAITTTTPSVQRLLDGTGYDGSTVDGLSPEGGNARPIVPSWWLDFDGVNDDVSFPDIAAYNISNNCTWFVRAKNDNALIPAATEHNMFCKYNRTGNLREWGLQLDAVERFIINFGDPADGSFEGTIAVAVAPVINETNSYAATFASGTVVMYINAVNSPTTVTAGSVPATMFNSTAPVTLGEEADGQKPWDGNIGEAYWFSYVLDQDEINWLHTCGAVGTEPDWSLLVMGTRLEAGSGTTAFDISANANHGTITGATWEGGAPHTYANEVGYTNASGVIVSKRANSALDAQGNALQYSGQALYGGLSKNSNCGRFDGSNDRALGGNFANYATEFTVMARFNSNDVLKNFSQILNKTTGSSATWNYAIQFNGTTGQLSAVTYVPSAGIATTSYALTNGVDYHAAMRFVSGSVKLYINGVNVASATPAAGTANQTTEPFRVGHVGTGSNVFDGKIWDVRTFGTALSDEQILNIAVNGVSYSNEDHWFPMGEGSGLKHYNVATLGSDLDLINITEASYWGQRQNVYPYNLTVGHNRYMYFESGKYVTAPVPLVWNNAWEISFYANSTSAGTWRLLTDPTNATFTVYFASATKLHVSIGGYVLNVTETRFTITTGYAKWTVRYDGAGNVTVLRNDVSLGVQTLSAPGTLTSSSLQFSGRPSTEYYVGIFHDIAIDIGDTGVNNHYYEGYDNTNEGWKDKIGSANGTVFGSPALLRVPKLTTADTDTLGLAIRPNGQAGNWINGAETEIDGENIASNGTIPAALATMSKGTVDLNGTTQYLRATQALALFNDATNAWTVLTHFKKDTNVSSDRIFAQILGETTFRGVSVYTNGSELVCDVIYDNGAVGERIVTSTSGLAIPTNRSVRAAVAYDGSKVAAGLTAYYQGAEVSLTPTGGRDTVATNDLSGDVPVIGASDVVASAELWFDGQIYEVIIYDRVLTDAEMNEYTKTGTRPPSPHRVYDMKYKGLDTSGNNQHMYAVASPTFAAYTMNDALNLSDFTLITSGTLTAGTYYQVVKGTLGGQPVGGVFQSAGTETASTSNIVIAIDNNAFERLYLYNTDTLVRVDRLLAYSDSVYNDETLNQIGQYTKTEVI